MSSSGPRDRPHRSHLRPACFACRRRKSRCKLEAHSPEPVCLMCRVHSTPCSFPAHGEVDAAAAKTPIPRRRKNARRLPTATADTPVQPIAASFTQLSSTTTAVLGNDSSIDGFGTDGRIWLGDEGNTRLPVAQQHTPLSVDDAEHENRHIIGPVATADSQVLATYLSVATNHTRGLRLIRPMTTHVGKPVMFAAVQKRPIGLLASQSVTHLKCEIIEKLLEPHVKTAIDVYVKLAAACPSLLPILIVMTNIKIVADIFRRPTPVYPSYIKIHFGHSITQQKTAYRLRCYALFTGIVSLIGNSYPNWQDTDLRIFVSSGIKRPKPPTQSYTWPPVFRPLLQYC